MKASNVLSFMIKDKRRRLQNTGEHVLKALESQILPRTILLFHEGSAFGSFGKKKWILKIVQTIRVSMPDHNKLALKFTQLMT